MSDRRERIDLVLHELRNPAAAVVGAARTLAAHGAALDAERRAALVRVLDAETARLVRLGRDLVAAARLDGGELPLATRRLDLGPLVAEAVEAARAAHPGADVRLDGPRQAVPVEADPERLGQALGNLLANAVAFGGGAGPVVVSLATAGGCAVVEVADCGPGVPADHAEAVFRRYGRAPGSGRPGTGIGLYVARAVAEAHGGTLELLSVAPEGAVFSLALPLSPA